MTDAKRLDGFTKGPFQIFMDSVTVDRIGNHLFEFVGRRRLILKHLELPSEGDSAQGQERFAAGPLPKVTLVGIAQTIDKDAHAVYERAIHVE